MHDLHAPIAINDPRRRRLSALVFVVKFDFDGCKPAAWVVITEAAKNALHTKMERVKGRTKRVIWW